MKYIIIVCYAIPKTTSIIYTYITSKFSSIKSYFPNSISFCYNNIIIRVFNPKINKETKERITNVVDMMINIFLCFINLYPAETKDVYLWERVGSHLKSSYGKEVGE